MLPLYTHCPHCGHPTIVHPARAARSRRCRQCYRAYAPSAAADAGRSATIVLNFDKPKSSRRTLRRRIREFVSAVT